MACPFAGEILTVDSPNFIGSVLGEYGYGVRGGNWGNGHEQDRIGGSRGKSFTTEKRRKQRRVTKESVIRIKGLVLSGSYGAVVRGPQSLSFQAAA